MNGINLNEIPLDVFMKYFNSNNLNDGKNKPSLIPMKSIGNRYVLNKSGHIKNGFSYESPIGSISTLESDIKLIFNSDDLTASNVTSTPLTDPQQVYIRSERNGTKILTYSKYVFLYKSDISKSEAERISISDESSYDEVYRYISLNDNVEVSPNIIYDDIVIPGNSPNIILDNVELIKHSDNEYLVMFNNIYHGKIILNSIKYIQETTKRDLPVYLDIYGNKTVKYDMSNKMSLQNTSLNRIFEKIQDPDITSQYRFYPNIAGLINSNSGKKISYYEQYLKTTTYERINPSSVPSGETVHNYIINPEISKLIPSIGNTHSYTNTLNNTIDVLNLNSLKRMIVVPIPEVENKYKLITNNPEKDFNDIEDIEGKPILVLREDDNNNVNISITTIKPDTFKWSSVYSDISVDDPHSELERYNIPSEFDDSKLEDYMTNNGLSDTAIYIRDTLDLRNVYKVTVEYTDITPEYTNTINKGEFLEYSHSKSLSDTDAILPARKELGKDYYIKRESLNESPFINLDDIDGLFSTFFQYIDLRRDVISNRSMSDIEREEIKDILVNKIESGDVYNTPLNIAGTSSVKRNAVAVGLLEFLNSSPLKERELEFRNTYSPNDKSYKLKLIQEKDETIKPIDFIDRKSSIKSKLRINNSNVYQRLVDYKKFPVNYINLKEMTDVDTRLQSYNQEVETKFYPNDIIAKNKKSYINKSPKLLDYKEIMITYMVNYFKYSIERSNKENIRESFDRFYKKRILETSDKTLGSDRLKELYIFSSNTMDDENVNYQFLLSKLDSSDEDWKVVE